MQDNKEQAEFFVSNLNELLERLECLPGVRRKCGLSEGSNSLQFICWLLLVKDIRKLWRQLRNERH
jgi:hypothetical protein